MGSAPVTQQLQQHIEAQLTALLRCSANGGDIAPGERLRLEGWIEAALLLAGSAAPQWVSGWQLLLSERGRLQCEETGGVWRARLDIWQSRAPVKPSTRD